MTKIKTKKTTKKNIQNPSSLCLIIPCFRAADTRITFEGLFTNQVCINFFHIANLVVARVHFHPSNGQNYGILTKHGENSSNALSQNVLRVQHLRSLSWTKAYKMVDNQKTLSIVGKRREIPFSGCQPSHCLQYTFSKVVLFF